MKWAGPRECEHLQFRRMFGDRRMQASAVQTGATIVLADGLGDRLVRTVWAVRVRRPLRTGNFVATGRVAGGVDCGLGSSVVF